MAATEDVTTTQRTAMYPTDPSSTTCVINQINDALRRHVAAHDLAGQPWPDDAMYAVLYNQSTWPCGYRATPSLRFFRARRGVDPTAPGAEFGAARHVALFLSSLRDWESLEDNFAEYRLYKWDLGPVLMRDRGNGHLFGKADVVGR